MLCTLVVRYFVPSLRLGVLMPRQARLEEKRGGLPWGLPQDRWPLCATCSRPQSFLAQLVHHVERLDLGAPGRTLLVFQCNHDPGMCETWAGGSGANACVVLEPGEVLDGLTRVPPGTSVETEARVIGWAADDDGVSAEDFRCFFDDTELANLPEEIIVRVPQVTKLGGPPAWIQGAGEAPKAPWRFALQLDCLDRFTGAAPSADEVGCTVTREVDGAFVREEPAVKKAGAPPWIHVSDDGYHCDGANFGDAGIAYVFVRTDQPRAQVRFFWQCG